MKHPARILVAAALLALAVGWLSYFCAARLCAAQVSGREDLVWLQREFKLTDAELQHIRQLHEGYLPKCREMCSRIASKREELDAALEQTGSASTQAEQKLVELGTLRAQCQAQMLRHFEEVSRAMAPAQGKRYLEEMKKLTLGSHDQFEHSMGKADAGHGHGQG